MLVSFTLTMPGVASWNGRWSGEGNLYVIVKSFRGKKQEAFAEARAKTGYYSYGWSDGWRAAISVDIVTAGEARMLRKRSNGFCAYEWMVDAILRHDRIVSSDDLKKAESRLPEEAKS